MTGGLTCIIPSHLTPKRQARVLAHHRAKLVFATRDLAATAAEKVVANIKAETPIAEMYERSGDFLPLAEIITASHVFTNEIKASGVQLILNGVQHEPYYIPPRRAGFNDLTDEGPLWRPDDNSDVFCFAWPSTRPLRPLCWITTSSSPTVRRDLLKDPARAYALAVIPPVVTDHSTVQALQACHQVNVLVRNPAWLQLSVDDKTRAALPTSNLIQDGMICVDGIVIIPRRSCRLISYIGIGEHKKDVPYPVQHRAPHALC
ncbi:hypothetical protein BC938DRAFT_471565, partial [Jimgerdemannia flammicorona]